MDYLVGKVTCDGYPLQWATVTPFYISGGTTHYIDNKSLITDKNGNYSVNIAFLSSWSESARRGVKVTRDGCSDKVAYAAPPSSSTATTPPSSSTATATVMATASALATAPPSPATPKPDTGITSAVTINVALTSTKRVATYASLYALGCETLGNSTQKRCLTYRMGGGDDIKIAGTHSQDELVLLSEILCNTGSTSSSGSTDTYTIDVSVVPSMSTLSVNAYTLASITTGSVTLNITVKYTTSTGDSDIRSATVTLSSSSSSVTKKMLTLGNGATFSTASVTSVSIESDTTGLHFTYDIVH